MSSGIILSVSPSLLGDVAACDTRAVVRHGKGYTSFHDSVKAGAGSAIHEAMAYFFNPLHEELSFQHRTSGALAAFHAKYDKLIADCPSDQLPEEAYLPPNLDRMLSQWFEMHPPSALPWRRVVSVETAVVSRTFVYNAPGLEGTQIRLICRPDMIVQGHDGLLRWVDTKTTGWRINDEGWKGSLRLSLQVALYTDALVQQYGRTSVSLGGWINAMEIKYLPGSDRPCQTHQVPYSECGARHMNSTLQECMLTDRRLAVAIADAERTAFDFARIKLRNDSGFLGTDVGMQGASKDGCRFCVARKWCEETSRNLDAVSYYLKYDPWVVEEGTR